MKQLTRQEKQARRKDAKSYHVAAVLDRAESDRILRPLPPTVEIRGQDGQLLTLSLTLPAVKKPR